MAATRKQWEYVDSDGNKQSNGCRTTIKFICSPETSEDVFVAAKLKGISVQQLCCDAMWAGLTDALNDVRGLTKAQRAELLSKSESKPKAMDKVTTVESAARLAKQAEERLAAARAKLAELQSASNQDEDEDDDDDDFCDEDDE